jgi:hypothetical protein
MRRIAITVSLLLPMGLGLTACDKLPESVQALFSKPQTVVTGAFKNGQYKGQLKVLFMEPKAPTDRNIQLLEPFGYKDSKGKDWDVPAGFVSDGASIPWSLWSFIGGPYDGPYRDAAVIHDYFCDKKDRPWEEVHAMFLEAALRRGTRESTAQTMYAGILYGGPRWEAPKLIKGQMVPGTQVAQATDPGLTKREATDAERKRFEALQRWIIETKPSPEEIKKKVEELRATEGKQTAPTK